MTLFQLISPLLGAPVISLLLRSIVNQHLFNTYCVTLISDFPIDFNFNLTYMYITPNETVDELKDQILKVSEDGCSDYIINMREPQLFMIALDLVSKAGNIRRSDRKIVILPGPDHEDLDGNNSLELFSLREADFVANILVILQSPKSSTNCKIYDLITHKFGTLDEKQPLFLDQWDSCTEEFKTNASLFPHDIKNLQGKIVNVAAFTYKPYVFLDLDPAIAPNGRDGMELRIIEEFCRWVNCSINIVRQDKDQWGEILPNGTGIGVIGSVVEDRADFGIGALYSWYEVFIYSDFSASIIRSAVTCLAPSPRLLESLTMPLMPFSWYMWYAVLITFIFASVGLILAKKSTDGVFFTVFGLMISQSQKNAELNWRVRSVTCWILVAGLILVSAYGGGLASTYTVPKYEASIDTVQDLVDRKLEWGATHDAWIFSLTLSPETLVKQLVSQFRIYSAPELKRRSFTRSMGFSIEKLPAGYFAIGDYLTKEALTDMTLMLEDFYYEQCVVTLRKSSPYTEKLSALVGRLHQSGLLLCWETQVALKHLSYEVQQEVKLSRLQDGGSIKPLTLQNIVGIFIFYVFGIALSVLLFFAERISNSMKK